MSARTKETFHNKGESWCLHFSSPLTQESNDDGSCNGCCFEVPLDVGNPANWVSSGVTLSSGQAAAANSTGSGLNLTTLPGGGTPDPTYQYTWDFYLNGIRLSNDEYSIITSNLFKAVDATTFFNSGDRLDYKYKKQT